MKKKYVVGILTLVIATIVTTIASGEIVNLTTLDYEDSEIIAVNGDVILEFNNSDTGTNEVMFLWRIYSPENNMTIYSILSSEIEYDHTFVNNTKIYTYYDNNTDKYYSIKVDYSSIQVPESYAEALNQTIKRLEEELNQTKTETNLIILSLETKIENLTAYIGTLNAILKGKNNTIILLTNERNELKTLNIPLYSEIARLENESKYWQDCTFDLRDRENIMEGIMGEQDKTIAQTTDSWCLGYTVYDPSSMKNNNHFYFNWPSIIIGMVIVIVFVGAIYWKKAKGEGFGKEKTLASHQNMKQEDFEDIPHKTPDVFKEWDEKEKGQQDPPEEKQTKDDIETIHDQLDNHIFKETEVSHGTENV